MEKELQEWYELHKLHFYSEQFRTKDLANFLGLNPRTIQRWLKEKTKPSKEQLIKIRQYLSQQNKEDHL